MIWVLFVYLNEWLKVEESEMLQEQSVSPKKEITNWHVIIMPK